MIKMNSRMILGTFALMTLLGLGACAESVIGGIDGTNPSVAVKPELDMATGEDPVTMKFKFNPSKEYDGNPVEALFPGQGDDSFVIQDLKDAEFRFDFEFQFQEKVADADGKNKRTRGEAELYMELLKDRKFKETTRKSAKKSKSKEKKKDETSIEDLELFRSFVSAEQITITQDGKIDRFEARMKSQDNDDESTVLVIRAQRKHSRTQDEAAKNPWAGDLFLIEDSKEFKMGEINGIFFQAPAQAQDSEEKTAE